MPRRISNQFIRRSSGDPNDPARAFWKFTEPDLPPVTGQPSPYTTPDPITYLGTPGVDYGQSIPAEAPRAEFYENSRGVFQNTPSLTVYGSGPDYAGFRGDEMFAGNFEAGRNRPHEAMDYYDSVANRPHSAMDFADTYESFPGADTARLEPSFLFGEPSVETPTAPFRSAGNLDTDQSLFPSPDEWWKQGTITANADVSASISPNDGGSIWEGSDTMGGFADNSLGRDLNASLGSLGFGEGYPAVESGTETPFSPTVEGTGIPIEPGVLPQDYEWTTSPNDRRFLPSPEQSSNPTGPDIRTFGGQSFGNNISLGQFLNTPLSSMRFGSDRYVSGGDVTYAGVTEHTEGGPQNDGTGTTTVGRQGSPSFETAKLRALGQISGGGWPTPPGMRIVGYDTQSAAPIYEDAQGNRFVNPGTGTPVSVSRGPGYQYDAAQSHYDSLMEMNRIAAEGFGSNVWSPDERILAASYDDEGNYIPSMVRHTGQIPFSGDPHDPTGSWAREIARVGGMANFRAMMTGQGGVRGVPATGGRG